MWLFICVYGLTYCCLICAISRRPPSVPSALYAPSLVWALPSSSTTRGARAVGFEVHAVPQFASRPVNWRAPAAQDFDALLLTSAFAAREAGPEIARLAILSDPEYHGEIGRAHV